MATIEKLLVQLSDRKRQISEQLNQRKLLLDQHLASKLLIQGFSPPSWLLPSSDLSALNKEELISGLLFPHLGPPVSYNNRTCFSYDKSFAAPVDSRITDQTWVEKCISSDCCDQFVSGFPLHHVDCNEAKSDAVHSSHVDISAATPSFAPMSPEDQIGTRISDKYNLQDQSLVKIQRSRSRQKALELRKSAKTSGKSRLGLSSNATVPSGSKICEDNEPVEVLRASFELADSSVCPIELPSKDETVVRTYSDCRGSSGCSDSSLPLSTCNQSNELEIGIHGNRGMSKKFSSGRIIRTRSSYQEPIHFLSEGKTSNYDIRNDATDFKLVNSSALLTKFCNSGEAATQYNSQEGNAAIGNRQISDRNFDAFDCSRLQSTEDIHSSTSQNLNAKDFGGVVADDEVTVKETNDESAGSMKAANGSQSCDFMTDMPMEPKQLHFDEVEESFLEGVGKHVSITDSYAVDGSWPLYKRRKIGNQNPRVSTIPCLENPNAKGSDKIGANCEVGAKEADRSVGSPSRGHELLPEMPHIEGKAKSGGRIVSPPALKHQQVVTPIVLSTMQVMIKEPAERIVEEKVKGDQICDIICNSGVSSVLVNNHDEMGASAEVTIKETICSNDCPSMKPELLSEIEIPEEADYSDGCPSMKPELLYQTEIPEDKAESGRRIVSSLTHSHEQPSTTSVLNTMQALMRERAQMFSKEKNVKADQISDLICGTSVSGGLVNNLHLDGNSSEQFTDTCIGLDGINPMPLGYSKISIASPLIEAMDVPKFDEMMPEFERFVAQDLEGIIQGEVSLLRDITERTSWQDYICKSSCSSTPMSPFPSACKLFLKPGIYSSAPNGLLENIDLKTNLSSDGIAIQGKSHSDIFPFNRGQCVWDVRKPFLSPIGKSFESVISKSGGSGKPGSGNPELTCFTILEDPESCDEDGHEFADTVMEGAASSTESSLIREPLGEIDALNRISVTQAPNPAFDKKSLESLSSKISISEMNNVDSNLKGMVPRRSRRITQGKENKGLSVGGSSKKHSNALSSRFSKPKLSGQSSLRSRGQTMSEKEPKRNNIVSNLKSFIPLVQQKQVAAAAPAKRDVKVKALEAAEAAKRLAEKKENERKLKKEALKLERARLEQESLKQMELAKKLKQEAKKKREAENAAKKRQIEEEEKKEKERKRKRIEEAFCQQKQAKEKIQAWREESRSVAEDESKNLYKKTQIAAAKGDKENISMKPENVFKMGEDVIKEIGDGITSLDDHKLSTGSSDYGKIGNIVEAECSTPNVGKTDNQRTLEQSYDMSPYQCSDNEEEEDDERSNKKFIPTWASKSCVAQAVSLQQHLDPDTIFLPGSFCSLEEVLVPRRIPQK